MYCGKCGTELPDGAIFCGKCGARQELTVKSRELGSDKGSVYAKGGENKGFPYVIVIASVVIVAIIGIIIVCAALKNSNNDEYSNSQVEDSVVFNQPKNNQPAAADDINEENIEGIKEESKETEDEAKENKDTDYTAANWSDFDFEDAAMQVADIMIWPGMSGEEFASALNSSDIDFDNDFNVDRIINGGGGEEIMIHRDGEEWIDCGCANLSENSNSLGKCQVTYLHVEDAAKKYSYFMGGISYNDLINMSYDEVKDIGNNLLKDYKFDELSTSNDDQFVLRYRKDEDDQLERSKWAGYVLEGTQKYSFYIDRDTGKVVDFDAQNIYTPKKSEDNIITDISELTQDEIDMLTNVSKEDLRKFVGYSVGGVKDFDEANVLEQYVEKNIVYSFVTLFELERNDGANSYVYVDVRNIYRGPDGVKYDKCDIGYEWDHDPR